MATGFYTDTYFNRTRQILLAENHHPFVRWQVFQKKEAVLCGVDEALGTMKVALGNDWKQLRVSALHDGDEIKPWETVMLVEGDLALFIHLETVILGALARRTRVATNATRIVRATKKPVLFFPARFDIHQAQAGDGYAFHVAAQRHGGVSTPAQADWWKGAHLGTIPHALEAGYGGDVVRATLAFAEHIEPEVKRIALVDYHNDCVRTSLEVADAMFRRWLPDRDERFRLHGVRLDTSETMVDRSLGPDGATGVSPDLVRNVHAALQERAKKHEYYVGIGIIVSGGFTPGKILQFETEGLPVAAYGVGSSMFNGKFDFTADVVGIRENGVWRDEAKEGRRVRANSRLEGVD